MCYPALVENERTHTDTRNYFLMDKCLNSNNRDCKSIVSEQWGSLYPVYDNTSDTMFYNKNCAECNGVKEYTHFFLGVTCADVNLLSNELMKLALQG